MGLHVEPDITGMAFSFLDLPELPPQSLPDWLLGEREGGPLRFESTPREGPNPYYKKFFESQSKLEE